MLFLDQGGWNGKSVAKEDKLLYFRLIKTWTSWSQFRFVHKRKWIPSSLALLLEILVLFLCHLLRLEECWEYSMHYPRKVQCCEWCTVQCTQYCNERLFSTLQCSVLKCSTLQCSILHCNVLHCSAVHCSAVHCSAVHCSSIDWSGVHWRTVHCSAAAVHCSAAAVQHTASE